MDPQAVLTELKKGDFAPLYFLCGEESFYIDQLTHFIETHALPEEERGFNQILAYGKETTLGKLVSMARGYPMMGSRQVIIVKEAQDLPDWKNQEMQQLFLEYAKNPQPSTILVLAHKYGKLDKRTSLGKSLPQYCVFVESKKIKDHEVIPWLERHLKSLGYSYTEKAVWLMAEKLGNNLERLHNEVEKLKNVLPSKEKIDEGLVSRHIGINREYNAFELQKALITRDGTKAMAIISYFAGNQKSNPFLMVLALLTTYFNKLLSFHYLRKKGEGNEARALKIPPFVIKEYELAARNFSLLQTRQIIGYLMDADKQVKGVGAYTKSELSIWKELIMKIITV